MVYQIAPFDITIPAGTAKTAPVHVATPLGQFVVVGIELTVPSGLNGAVGFRFTSNGAPVIPADPTRWIIVSGQPLAWPISGQLSSGAWEITGYNTGKYDHTMQVRYLLDLPAGYSNAAPSSPLSVADIMAQGGTIIAGSLPAAGP